MKLLIDIGNQRIKWATSDQITVSLGDSIVGQAKPDARIDEQVVTTHSATLVDQLEQQFRRLPIPESVWMSCVSAESIKKKIIDLCEIIWKLSPSCMRATARAMGVENGYQNPVSLGFDRWAANVAARYISGQVSLVVIDAGTAVTIDYINRKGRFLGGTIFPGVVTMVESLHTATGQIQETAPLCGTMSHDVTHIRLFNADTQSAVENGVLLAVVAGIDGAIDQCRLADHGELKIIITGGDAKCVASLSVHDMKHQSNLVLIGLLLLSEEAK